MLLVWRVWICGTFLLLAADIGYESLINLMLKDLFKLLVACVSEPAETISRVGCSCIRWTQLSIKEASTHNVLLFKMKINKQ